MNTQNNDTPVETGPEDAEGTVRIEAYYDQTKCLGHWTSVRSFDVRARRSSVQLDLRSAQIPEGDIEIKVTAERSMLKLLVPEDAVVDQADLAFVGLCKVKDSQRHADHTGRRIRLVGTLQRGEVRIVRGGMATLTAMFSKAFVDDVRHANDEGTLPTVHAPDSIPEGTPRDSA